MAVEVTVAEATVSRRSLDYHRCSCIRYLQAEVVVTKVVEAAMARVGTARVHTVATSKVAAPVVVGQS